MKVGDFPLTTVFQALLIIVDHTSKKVKQLSEKTEVPT